MSILPTAYTEESCRDAAKRAHLRYVKDTSPGISRKRHGKGFRYLAPDGENVTDEEVLSRIRALAIPPGYNSVWICPIDNGHLQATGRDERRRKQYIYHPKWEQHRTLTKFDQLAAFADALPALRKRIAHDIALPGMPREKIVAAILQIMDETYGLTTLRKDHVDLKGSRIRFTFTGKGNKEWQRDITDPKVAAIVKQCEELPGQELFKYLDDENGRHDITSDHVNEYLQEVTGQPFTAKDFRTWAATSQALDLLGALQRQPTERSHKRQMSDAIKTIAASLGHTPTICRKSYIHPEIITCYRNGELSEWYAKQAKKDDLSLIASFLKLT